jgi:hypothetical protein
MDAALVMLWTGFQVVCPPTLMEWLHCHESLKKPHYLKQAYHEKVRLIVE